MTEGSDPLSFAFLGQHYISDIYVANRRGERRREREKDEDINKVASAAAALVVIPSYGGRRAATSGVKFS